MKPAALAVVLAAKAVLLGHSDVVHHAAFMPGDGKVVTASWDGTIRVWDASTGKALATIDTGLPVNVVAASPDGRSFAAAGRGALTVWDARTGKKTADLEGHGGERKNVVYADYSPDGRLLASAGADGTVRVWDPSGRKPPRVLSGHESGVVAVRFSPDGRRLYSASGDKTIRVWDPATGKELAVWRGHENTVRGLAPSRDGKFVVSASYDGTARVWDAARGEVVRVQKVPGGVVNMAELLPDGRLLTCGRDAYARIWGADGAEPEAVLSGHEGWVESFAVSRDGARAATTGWDKTVRLWSLKPAPR